MAVVRSSLDEMAAACVTKSLLQLGCHVTAVSDLTSVSLSLALVVTISLAWRTVHLVQKLSTHKLKSPSFVFYPWLSQLWKAKYCGVGIDKTIGVVLWQVKQYGLDKNVEHSRKINQHRAGRIDLKTQPWKLGLEPCPTINWLCYVSKSRSPRVASVYL